MNPAVPFRQLVERRLWPLAVLLVAALVAVPMLLSKEPATPVAAVTATAAGAQGDTQPIVSVGDPALLSTDVGPVIDEDAHRSLQSHLQRLQREGLPGAMPDLNS